MGVRHTELQFAALKHAPDLPLLQRPVTKGLNQAAPSYFSPSHQTA